MTDTRYLLAALTAALAALAAAGYVLAKASIR